MWLLFTAISDVRVVVLCTSHQRLFHGSRCHGDLLGPPTTGSRTYHSWIPGQWWKGVIHSGFNWFWDIINCNFLKHDLKGVVIVLALNLEYSRIVKVGWYRTMGTFQKHILYIYRERENIVTSLGVTWSLKLQKALNGRLIILMSSYACLQIYLNGVSYCQVFPSNHNSLNIAGVAGGRMYEVELEVFPKDTMYLPHKSNKLVNVTEWYKFTFSNVIKQNDSPETFVMSSRPVETLQAPFLQMYTTDAL